MNFSTEGVQEQVSKTFTPGISTVKFTGVTFQSAKKDGTGDPVIAMNFSDGVAEMNKKVWSPTSNLEGQEIKFDRNINVNGKTYELKAGSTYTKEQADAVAMHNFLAEIKHLTNRLDESMNVSGNSYAEFAKDLITKTNPHKGKEVKIATEFKGQYLEIRKNRPFLANVDDSGTLEKLLATGKLNLNKVQPDAEPVTIGEESDSSLPF